MSKESIRVIKIEYETAADGPGLRTSIYCAGCKHMCPGCHNVQSWDFNAGRDVSINSILRDILDDPYANVTFTGGDPLYQVDEFTKLAKKIKENSNKTIWLYTGFTYEQILESDKLSQILPYIDVIVDGPFINDLRDTNLQFRGSSNQKIIYLHEKQDKNI